MAGLFTELKRRNVFRVGAAYGIVGWMLVEVASVLLPTFGAPDWVMKAFSALVLLGFPLAVILAWAFELTPEGLKLEKNVERDESIAHNTGRKLDFVIIGVLVAALAASMYANFGDAPLEESAIEAADDAIVEAFATSSKPASIAVLPFANRSADPADAFFVDGMHDDLLTQLAKISALKVISRTSVLQYRDTEKSMKTIGDELGVTTLLEGGVQRAGNRIRINVQLIDAQTDGHLWAETYNRELTTENIFEIQEEMSLEIARALHATLSPAEQQRIADRPTNNMKAYEAYLIGRQRLATRNVPDILESLKYFELAIEEDENFAHAYASLAEAHMVLNNNGTIALEQMLENIRPLVEKAKSLNDDIGMVYNVMGGLEEYEGNLELAETYYRKAIEVSPSYTTAYIWLALFLNIYKGEHDEALELYRTASELDPVATLPRFNLAVQLNSLGKPKEAIELIRKTIEIDPTVSTSYAYGGLLLAYGLGDFAEAIAWTQYASAIDDSNLSSGGEYYARLGDWETAIKWQKTYVDMYPDSTFARQYELERFADFGEPDGTAEVAQRILKQSLDTYPIAYIVSVLGKYYIGKEREKDAVELYSNFFPELFDDLPDVNRANVEVAINLIRLHQLADIAGGSSLLAERSFAVMESMPRMSYNGKSILDVELHSIMGNRDAAIAAFSEALDSGWYRYISPLRHFPNLQNISSDAKFIQLLALNQKRVDQELAKVREMEQNGQLARTPAELPGIEFDLSF